MVELAWKTVVGEMRPGGVLRAAQQLLAAVSRVFELDAVNANLRAPVAVRVAAFSGRLACSEARVAAIRTRDFASRTFASEVAARSGGAILD